MGWNILTSDSSGPLDEPADPPAAPCSADVADSQAPIMAVGAAVYRRSGRKRIELLLIKKRYGLWTLPKGHVKAGEPDTAAVLREVAEETSITAIVEAPLLTVAYNIWKRGRVQRKLVSYYLLEAKAGKPRPAAKEKIVRARWFSISAAIRRVGRERVRSVVLRAAAVLADQGKR